MRDVRVLCSWPERMQFRRALLPSGQEVEEGLSELGLTTGAGSLEMAELIISLERAYGVEYAENR
jgi:hypothetical protein